MKNDRTHKTFKWNDSKGEKITYFKQRRNRLKAVQVQNSVRVSTQKLRKEVKGKEKKIHSDRNH